MNLSEVNWQQQVTDLASLCGWRWNHTRRSIGKDGKWTTATSVTGWPDLFLWHPTAAASMFVELKTDRGRVTAAQAEVLESLRAAGVDARVWRPRDWDCEVQPTLTAQRIVRSAG